MEAQMEAQRQREQLPSEAYNDDNEHHTPKTHYERVQANVQQLREQKDREEKDRQAFERTQAAASAEKARIEREQKTRRERDERAHRNTPQFPSGNGRVVTSHYDILNVLPTASIEVIKGYIPNIYLNPS